MTAKESRGFGLLERLDLRREEASYIPNNARKNSHERTRGQAAHHYHKAGTSSAYLPNPNYYTPHPAFDRSHTLWTERSNVF